MVTITQLLDFNVEGYRPLIEKWGQAADAISSAASTISSTGDQMSTWTGPAADQAVNTMGHLVEVVADAPQLLNEAQDTLGAFVTAVYQQQEVLKAAVHKAESLGCFVADDGTVTPPPQPAGEPPQACPPDPHLAAKWAQEQEAYDNNPAVKNWRTATEQAPGLQSTIQGALQAATAADARAERDLEAGIRGGTDIRKIVAGQDRTGSYLADLYGAGQTAADGQRWMEQYVHQAAALLPKAANGDIAAAAQIGEMTPLSWDQAFGASLMNQLGAAGLEKLPVEMGQKMQDLHDGGLSASMPGLLQADRTVLQFLGDSLASASSSPDLSPEFVRGLLNDQTVPASEPSGLDAGPAGFWALGQILGASTGAVQYNAQFLDTVGTAIIHFDSMRDPAFGYEDLGPFTFPWANNLNLPLNAQLDLNASYHAIADSGGDPVYGLMHAATISPAAAQTLFSSHGNLNTLLTQLPWQFDHGSSLGAALQSATAGPGPVTAAIASNMVHIMAGQYSSNSGYAAQMSGINSHVASILAEPQNIMAINRAIAENIQNTPGTAYHYPEVGGQGGIGPSFHSGDLALVLGAVGQTPAAYTTLQNAEAHYMAGQLNQAVASAMGEKGGLSNPQANSAIQQALSQGMTTLGYMGAVKTLVAQNGANASAAALISDLQDGSTAAGVISTITGALPAVSIPASLVSTALGYVGGQVHASQAPTIAGAQQAITLPNFGTMALAGALLKNHAAPPSDFGNSTGQFWGPDGQLLPTADLIHNQTAMATMNSWIETVHTVGPFTFNQSAIDQNVIGALQGQNNMTASGG